MTDGREKSREIAEAAREVRDLLEYASTLGMKEIPSPPPSQLASAATAGPPLTAPQDKGTALLKLRERIGDCRLCKLHKGRTNLVFGAGNANADIMFIGEGPGREEDLQGEPFVGPAGQLLTKIIEAMGYRREDVYIANVIKCRPPDNRNPEPDEVKACIGFLISQVEIIRPRAIVCLGGVALQALFSPELKISRARGRFLEWHGIPVMPTYHPAFLLRNADMKRPVWEDMQNVLKLLKKS